MRRYIAADKMPMCACCTQFDHQAKHGRGGKTHMRVIANRSARKEGKMEIESQLQDS